MEVVVTLKRRDVFVGGFLNLYRRPAMWGISAIPGLLISSQEWAKGAELVGAYRANALLLAFFALLTVALLLTGVLVSCGLMALRPGMMRGVLGRHFFRISDEGLEEQTHGQRSQNFHFYYFFSVALRRGRKITQSHSQI